MPILIGLGSIILLAVLFAPQWWVRHVLARHVLSQLQPMAL
jgi:hypothetical protein